ncbi:MAG TPA: hypothetical protein VK832_00715, partial [Burkholderiaceae bacterium]|nr:hypothetical protein [Burkholderiaceae bacterium]
MASMTLPTKIRMCTNGVKLREKRSNQISIELMAIKFGRRITLFSAKLTKIFLQQILDQRAIHLGYAKTFEKANRA